MQWRILKNGQTEKPVVKATGATERNLISRSLYHFSQPLCKIKLSQQEIIQVNTFVLVCLFFIAIQIV